MAEALGRALIAHFDSIFEGPNGDYPAVLQSLAGVTAEQAAWKPAPGHNSIWQIVEHLTASNVWQIQMLDLGQAELPVWKEPKGGAAAWLGALRELRETHAHLTEALGRLTDKELLTIPVPETKETQLELLLSMAAHEAHHSGQIDYLKGMQAKPEEKPSAVEGPALAGPGLPLPPPGHALTEEEARTLALSFSPKGKAGSPTAARPTRAKAPSLWLPPKGQAPPVTGQTKKRKK
jgi:uncharacterized damage-inducible protein DinB